MWLQIDEVDLLKQDMENDEDWKMAIRVRRNRKPRKLTSRGGAPSEEYINQMYEDYLKNKFKNYLT